MKLKFNLIVLLSVLSLTGYNTSAQDRSDAGTVLYNGITLPKVWPPRAAEYKEPRPMAVPYLKSKPAVIPINTGRQLFVDSFLVAETNLAFVHHTPAVYKNNPVLEPTEEWEYSANGPYAMPFSDGVWYDEINKKYKMWYLTGAGRTKNGLRTAYAESDDGIKWVKPSLDILENTNIVDTTNRDAATIWLDKSETDPAMRYKMFVVQTKKDNLWPLVLKYASDGIHWSEGVAQSGGMFDRTTVFYNPFLSKWILSMKAKFASGRAREYMEQADEKMLVSLAHRVYDNVSDDNIVPWFGADDKDPRNPFYPEIKPQIYNHDAIAYESLLLGYFTVWQGPENDITSRLKIQKRNEILVGYSRDGFHWNRPLRKPFIGVNPVEGAWNWGNVQSVAGAPIIKGDSLYFYFSGRRLSKYSWDSYSSTGLATLRRDGFVSVNSGKNEGYLTTEPIIFDGNYLWINTDVRNGKIWVEILDEYGQPIEGFTKKDCIPVQKVNSTKTQIQWKKQASTGFLAGRKVRFRFHLTNGDLYSFWVSPWKTGESRGYTGGGGPGLNATGIDIPIADQ